MDITTKGPDHLVEVWAFFVPNVAERVGFEPTMRLPPYRFSSVAPDVVSCNARHYSVQICQATTIGFMPRNLSVSSDIIDVCGF